MAKPRKRRSNNAPRTLAVERWLKRAIKARAAKAFASSAAAAKRVTDLIPNQCEALHLLAQIAVDSKQYQVAIQRYQHLLSQHPHHAVAHYELGSLLHQSGALQPAIACYQSAIECRPRYLAALCAMGDVQLHNHDAQAAEISLRQALTLAPDDAAIRSRLAQALHAQQKTAAAIKEVQYAIKLAPKSANHRTDLGSLYASQGDLQEALEAHRKALQLEPANAKSALNLAFSKRFSSSDEADIERIRYAVAHASSDPLSRRYAYLAIAKVLDDRQDWEQAFSHCRQAHQPFAASARVDAHRTRLLMQRIATTFDSHFMPLPPSGDPAAIPVFIVGMPRSGTTLVENIIAAHPNAHGAGELSYIPRLAQQIATDIGSGSRYPEVVHDLTPSHAKYYGERYLQQLRQHHPSATHIVDKLPGNYLYLGLIAMILHNAKIIYCRRNPFDIAISLYFTDFTSGHRYAHDLAAIGEQINNTRKLMEHWQTRLPFCILTIDYETLVTDLENVGKTLLRHIRLSWNPACLRPHLVARTISTASQWQIRQPLYRHAIDRARHYQHHLESVRKALEDDTLLTSTDNPMENTDGQ